jgi:hypothetical protein
MTANLTREDMVGQVGLVVPVYYREQVPDDVCENLLRTTLAGYAGCLQPQHIVLVVDGAQRLTGLAERLSSELACGAFRVKTLRVNQGKGGALVVGWEELLADEALKFIAVRDADGDHFLDDLPHLFRLGEQIVEDTGSASVVIIGRRTAVHPSLGWRRGECELAVNAILVEALQFSLASRGRVLPRQYWAADVLDLQSGYKLYSRAACAVATSALRKAEQEGSKFQPLRYGMELIPFAAICAAGGIAGEAPRYKEYHTQPVTNYGDVDWGSLFGDPLAWTLHTLSIDPVAACQFFDNALARSLMMTDPAGRRDLLTLRGHTLEKLAALWGTPLGQLPEPQTRRFL